MFESLQSRPMNDTPRLLHRFPKKSPIPAPIMMEMMFDITNKGTISERTPLRIIRECLRERFGFPLAPYLRSRAVTESGRPLQSQSQSFGSASLCGRAWKNRRLFRNRCVGFHSVGTDSRWLESNRRETYIVMHREIAGEAFRCTR